MSSDYVVVQNKWLDIEGALYSCSKWTMTLTVTNETRDKYGKHFMHRRHPENEAWWIMSFSVSSELNR